ncbi:hypothetical protein D5086_009530 [Populus alba]|uniref:Uncharacterized protein n=1 Tax=Populus alba TaxID=43335 RepID=A0ACC4CIM7_POPAL
MEAASSIVKTYGHVQELSCKLVRLHMSEGKDCSAAAQAVLDHFDKTSCLLSRLILGILQAARGSLEWIEEFFCLRTLTNHDLARENSNRRRGRY